MDARRVAVIGGGIAGSTAAHAVDAAARRNNIAVNVTLFEAGERLGGKIYTGRIGDRLVEWGADSFLGIKPAGLRLARDLGLQEEIVTVAAGATRTYLWLGGRLRPLPTGLSMGIPSGPASLARAISAGILSPLGAARAALEPFVPRRPFDDPSIGRVMRYRFGHRAAERLVGPLVQGIYGLPMDELSFEALLPQFAANRATLRQRKALKNQATAAAPMFVSLRRGLSCLVDALASTMQDSVRTTTPVVGIEKDGLRYRVITAADDNAFDAVIVATPASDAAGLLETIAPEAVGPLSDIAYRGTVVVHVAYPSGSLDGRPQGSGYLVAPEEVQTIQACSWTDRKWPHLGGNGHWLRATVSDPRAVTLDEDVLKQRVLDELNRHLGALDSPISVDLHRWPQATPVYAPGHVRRVNAAEAALPSNVALAGAAYHGSGVADCIATGTSAAERIVATLRRGS